MCFGKENYPFGPIVFCRCESVLSLEKLSGIMGKRLLAIEKNCNIILYRMNV